GAIALLTEPEPWEPNGRPRRGAVSSFGISGTNVHAILEEAPATEGAEEGEKRPLPGPIPLTLSAKSDQALQAQAARLLTHLKEHPEAEPTDIAYSLATTRAKLEHRAVVLGSSREELLGSLESLAEGKDSPALTRALAQSGPLAFLFTGQGSQRV